MSPLAIPGEKHERKMLPLLKKSNNRVMAELRAAENRGNTIRQAIGIPEPLVDKLRKLDRLKTELPKIRTLNSRMAVSIASLAMKTDELRAALHDLRKERNQKQKAYSEALKNRNRVSNLRSKIVPAPKLKVLKAELAKNSDQLRNVNERLDRLKKELPAVVQEKERLKEALGQILKTLPSTLEQVTYLKERIRELSPKVVTEEQAERLEKEVGSLRLEKEKMAAENRELSPRAAGIDEEEEKARSVLEGYRSKNEKDGEALSRLRKISRELDISEDKMLSLKERASGAEQALEGKRGALEKLKGEYSRLLDNRQKYKSIIDEVEESTDQLQEMLNKRK